MTKHCEFCGKAIEDFKRSTKKYCNYNCKQLAFYARQGMAWGKSVLSDSDGLQLNVKSDFTLSDGNENTDWNDKHWETNCTNESIIPNDSTPKNVDTVKQQEAKKDPIQFETQPKYRRIESRLLNAIERHKNHIENMFLMPENYWTKDAIPVVHWVTTRVRCLLVNIIRLSNFTRIDRTVIVKISNALTGLVGSSRFRRLPRNYPFTELIHDLQDKFARFAEPMEADEISFKLSLERKAQYIAYNFMIGNFVPRCKFSELKFCDQAAKHTNSRK